jgi:hydroxymethylpyrimidine pyrophosphatase-like HAD family hydrolase
MSEIETSARYDLVICDVDGCLAPESASPMDAARLAQVAEHNRLAAERRDRPILTVCTGRPQPFAEAMCRLVHNDSVPCVAENGVWLYYPGSNLYEMDPDITPEHLDAVHEASKLLAAKYGPRGVTQQPGKVASVTLFHPDTEYLRSIAPAVREELERRGWPFRVSMTWLYINCDLKHVSKASGVHRLQMATGVERARTAGIGDTMSDLPIAEAVDLFACPANAAEEIKQYAHYVSPHEETAGVLDILRHLSQG